MEEDNTELNELARERAGEPEPSEVMELERERETTVRSSSALALVKLEQTELSSSETAGAARVGKLKSLSQRVERHGHAVAEQSVIPWQPSEPPIAIRLRLRRRPPRRVRFGNLSVFWSILQGCAVETRSLSMRASTTVCWRGSLRWSLVVENATKETSRGREAQK